MSTPFPVTRTSMERDRSALDGALDPTEHIVQLYETDDFLADMVSSYLSAGLAADDACVVIATPAHRASIETQIQARLHASGGDRLAAREGDGVIWQDAAETLATFMVDGAPEPERFAAVIGGILAQATRGTRDTRDTRDTRHVRIFGEMVALLWAEGNQLAAIRLEELWNELRATSPHFSLCCAYPTHGFAGEGHAEPFAAICAEHSRVIPDERYTAVDEPDQRLRAISLLQQKASSLEAEVAERKAAERQIVAQAGQITATFQALTDGLLVFDTAGHLIQMNPAARALLMLDTDASGYTLPATGSASRFDVRDEQGHALPSEAWPITRVLRGEVLADADATDVVIRALDGRERQLSITGSPIRGERDEIIGGVCIMRDVTERRRLEQRTRQALDALLQTAEALVRLPATAQPAGSPDEPSTGSAVAQQLAGLTRAVAGCERVTIAAIDATTGLLRPVAVVGLSAGDERHWRRILARHRLEDYVPAEDMARLHAGNVVVADLTHVPPQDQPAFAPGRAILAPIQLSERLVGMLSLGYGPGERTHTPDEVEFALAAAKLAALVIERDRLLRERAAAEAQVLALQEANRRMDEFLGIAGHELRTPLTAIRANAQIVNRTLRHLLDAEGTTAIDPAAIRTRVVPLTARIERQSHRQERLVNDLLDVSRIDAGRLELHTETTDLATLVRECVEEQLLLNPRRTITLALPPEHHTIPIQADPDRIGQVIVNYLTNALKYSPEDQPVAVALAVASGIVRLSVRDHGQGLPPDALAHVWDRFHRVPGIEVMSGSGVGLGLGLYISKTIIERQQGSVGVESAPERGSTFWFTLPLAQSEA